MSRRNLSLQRRCAWWLNECLLLGWSKDELPALEKLFWKYKPWNMKKMAKRGPALAVDIGKIAEGRTRERAAATTEH